MNLADQATADLAIMLNDREFARSISLDGAPAVHCILDEELAKAGFEGVREWDATLYVRASDYPAPVVDQRITVGARSAIVVHTNTVHSLQTIRLRWYES